MHICEHATQELPPPPPEDLDDPVHVLLQVKQPLDLLVFVQSWAQPREQLLLHPWQLWLHEPIQLPSQFVHPLRLRHVPSQPPEHP